MRSRVLFCIFLITFDGIYTWGNNTFNHYHSDLGNIITQGGVIRSNSKDIQDASLEAQVSPMITDEEVDELLFGDLFSEDLDEESEFDYLPRWYNSLKLETAVGYADNPLYANYQPQGSAFGFLGIEALSMSQASSVHQLLLYFLGEGKKYTDLRNQDLAGMMIGQIDYSFNPAASSFGYGLRIQHTYFDQGMDFSEIGLPYRMKVVSNRSGIRPRINWQLNESLKSELEVGFEQEVYQSINDTSEDLLMAMKLSGEVDERWKWKTGFAAKNTNFKHRNPKTADGNVTGSKLTAKIVEASTSIEYEHDHRNFEETEFKIGFKRFMDEEGDYYDYQRWKIIIAQGLSFEPWSADFSMDYSETSYGYRLLDGGQILERSGLNFDLSISYQISEHWISYMKWNHESETSNDPSYLMDANSWSLGVTWEN